MNAAVTLRACMESPSIPGVQAAEATTPGQPGVVATGELDRYFVAAAFAGACVAAAETERIDATTGSPFR